MKEKLDEMICANVSEKEKEKILEYCEKYNLANISHFIRSAIKFYEQELDKNS